MKTKKVEIDVLRGRNSDDESVIQVTDNEGTVLYEAKTEEEIIRILEKSGNHFILNNCCSIELALDKRLQNL